METGARIHVITGGPGSGKTTLIDALRERGFACTDEAGRRIIREERENAGQALPWRDPRAFAERMLAADLRSHAWALAQPGRVFADRGAPDIIGYLRISGLPVEDAFYRRCTGLVYAQEVFIAPPWAEIFEQDNERRQDFPLARVTFDAMRRVYGELGYRVTELPRIGVAERVDFVLDRLNLSGAP
ncbi:AAA family ATPase [Pseudomonas sp. RIT-PI-AD]|uniref:AAA family ATPase n=1 Tax=Pseudomonas sp. RIT-PI-AD TaxID=3035294 RepID=UPI0021D9139B|nr:AAA family ATPase [Pseudomonas sp. RIT-PI-AD]